MITPTGTAALQAGTMHCGRQGELYGLDDLDDNQVLAAVAPPAMDALTHRYTEAPQLLRARILILLSSIFIWVLRRWTCTEIRRPWLR
jgi:hypothetical protein